MTSRVVLSDEYSVIVDIARYGAGSIMLMQESLEAMSKPTNGTVKLPNGVQIVATDVLVVHQALSIG